MRQWRERGGDGIGVWDGRAHEDGDEEESRKERAEHAEERHKRSKDRVLGHEAE